MLTPKQVNEAQGLLARLTELDRHLERRLSNSKSLQLFTSHDTGETYVTCSPAIRQKVFELWREDVLAARAAIHRRLAQLNINWKG